MSYFLNGTNISNYIIPDISTNTNISGYKINNKDLLQLYSNKINPNYGLTVDYGIPVNYNYTFNGTDISRFFIKKIFSSATATYDVTEVNNGVLIRVTSSGDLNFMFNLTKLSFVLAGAGGNGNDGVFISSIPRYIGAGGGGGGELIYGTYSTSTNQKITQLNVTIGNNDSNITSNDNFLNITAFKGGDGGSNVGKTFAELSRQQKNFISHRSRALKLLCDHLRSSL